MNRHAQLHAIPHATPHALNPIHANTVLVLLPAMTPVRALGHVIKAAVNEQIRAVITIPFFFFFNFFIKKC